MVPHCGGWVEAGGFSSACRQTVILCGGRTRWCGRRGAGDRVRGIGVYGNLGRIEIGGFQHGFNRSCHGAICRRWSVGWESITAGGARSPGRGDCSLLRRLLDGGVNVEGPSKPDDAEQEHGHQGQDQRGLGDLRPVSASELTCDSFDVRQSAGHKSNNNYKLRITNYKFPIARPSP